MLQNKMVYLSGSCKNETLDDRSGWRSDCVTWFCKNADRFIAFNPVAYFDYDRNDHKTELEVLDFERRAVKKSDVMLVNLRNIEKSVGTICELAWAFEYDIPIVAFYESEDEYELQLHPWIENMCDRIECGIGAMEKALRYVRDYYSVF